ncbi:uncharacterized protein LACBIDRAFT_328192 [Laccaria bicolor S238N-H82]|uniref:Predicted protein n=1 Tax=Laccaria bicolor (strain S238N-H82 / ATCC MYA-4686) TaxID=486041 RepID=B0DE13_LACBS|nr:uncharacterized protein LACBIDRAFT_328192 [Laccaria bicolor S238N-H82]EDR07183.1 predicted protein [Laccaria bicolor S238N-H82]|eukprot:XP_001882114.1 predicted protein [Laccaria bicolor S238N-H82]
MYTMARYQCGELGTQYRAEGMQPGQGGVGITSFDRRGLLKGRGGIPTSPLPSYFYTACNYLCPTHLNVSNRCTIDTKEEAHTSVSAIHPAMQHWPGSGGSCAAYTSLTPLRVAYLILLSSYPHRPPTYNATKTQNHRYQRIYIEGDNIQQLLHIYLEEPTSDTQASILEEAPFWPGFVLQGLSLYQAGSESYALFSALHDKMLEGKANHQERRRIVDALGLCAEQVSIIAIIEKAATWDDAVAEVQERFGALLVLRQRRYLKSQLKDYPGGEQHDYRCNCPAVEVRAADTPDNAILCCAETGFYVLPFHQSTVFVSLGVNKRYKMELVVARDVPQDIPCYTPFVTPLMLWLELVIEAACSSRRDPTHPGKMVQIGLNMGARHARILGWAQSFTRDLTHEQKVQQDTDLLGGMSLLWALIKAYLPTDVTKPVQDKLDGIYPTMATRNVPEGCGFSISIDGTDYTFSQASRAPPEGVATVSYEAPSHTDGCATIWAFACTVARRILSPQLLPSAHLGSNFIDFGLGVVVQGAARTLTAFQPEHLHATSYRGSVFSMGLAMNSTAWVELAMCGLEIDNLVAVRVRQMSMLVSNVNFGVFP